MPQQKLRNSIASPEKSVSIDPTQAAFSIPQISAYTGLSHWRVRMAIWQGRLAAKKVGKSLIILRADADAFLAALPAVSANKSDWLARRQAVNS
jgi:hypothetical protein